MNKRFHVIHMKKVIRLVVCILVPLAVGGLSALITKDNIEIYKAFAKPPLAPPGWLFPVVWSVLYVLMGIASFLILERGYEKDYVKDAINFYAIQLILNFLWPILFFRFRLPFLAFWELVILWIFAGITTAKFYRIKHAAGFLMLPYWIWLTFAAYLNLGIWLLNR